MKFTPDGTEDLGLLKHAARRFAVLDRETPIGHVVEAGRGDWRPVLPSGERAQFVLPSRKQAAEWLRGAWRSDSESA